MGWYNAVRLLKRCVASSRHGCQMPLELGDSDGSRKTLPRDEQACSVP